MMFRCCCSLDAAFVAHARMGCPFLYNVRIARMALSNTTLHHFKPHFPHRSLTRQSSTTCRYFAQKATLCFCSELNFAVAIYCTTKTVRMRGVLPAWFGARQHSNNGFGHLSKGPETSSQSVAVESTPCTCGGSSSQVATEHARTNYYYFEALTGRCVPVQVYACILCLLPMLPSI